MSFCNQCGSEQDETNAWCTQCGEANTNLRLQTSEPSAIPSETTANPYLLKLLEHFKKPYFREASGTILVSVIAFISLSVLSGRTNSGYLFFGWLVFFLLLCPLSFGAFVILFSREISPRWLVSFENWLDHRCAKAAESSGRFNDYVIFPSLWVYEKLNTTTDQIGDDILRNGAKAATYVFTVCLFLFLLYVAIGIVLFIIGIAIAIAIINAWEESNGSGRRSAGTATYVPTLGREGKFYQGSNWFTEELAGRVDEEGNIYRGSNWFAEEKIGRVDEEGNIYKGSNWFAEEKVGRIDGDGNIHRGSNWFTEEKTGRIDDEGNVYKGSNWFTEEKIGRVEERD